MIKPLKNLARVCFPDYFEKKRIKLLNAVIGKDTVIYPQASIINPNDKTTVILGESCHIAGVLITSVCNGKIKIGNYSFIGDGSKIYSFIGVTIGNHVQIAHNVNIFDSNIHSLDPVKRQQEFIINTTKGLIQINNLHEKEVVIGNNVWIGAGSFILKGVNIGENTIVGAGSVVVKDLPPNVIAVGNPARIVKKLP